MGPMETRPNSSMLSCCAILFLLMRTGKCAHPHPNATRQIKEHHRSMLQTNPAVSLINAGLCSQMSHQECLELEDEMRESARRLESIYVQQGFVRVLVLLIQFRDHRDRELPPVEHYEELFNGVELSDIIPTGSISQWLEDNSYGALKIEAEVIDWVVTDMTEEEYSFSASGLDVEFRKSMYPALDQLESEGFDFGRFDMNGDNFIDSVILLHSGYAAEIGGIDCYSEAEPKDRIWSHALAYRDDNWKSENSGISLLGYGVSSGLRGLCFSSVARLSVITHEFLHTLGLPDLIDTGGDGVGRGTGDFDIMSNAHARDGEQLLPSCLSPWSKIKLGWSEPVEIITDGFYEIAASEESNDFFTIRKNFPDGEYLIIENRQPIMWDQLLWDGGLLIWHLDDKQETLKNRGYPGQVGWPGNGRHYGLALVAADGNYDIELGNNSGDDGDFWRSGTTLGPALVENEATDDGVYPNTNSYQMGNIQQTGIIIDEISQSGKLMSFRVRGLTSPEATHPAMNPTAVVFPVSFQIPVPNSVQPMLSFQPLPTSLPGVTPSELSISPASPQTTEPSVYPYPSHAQVPSPEKVPIIFDLDWIETPHPTRSAPSETAPPISPTQSLSWFPLGFPTTQPTTVVAINSHIPSQRISDRPENVPWGVISPPSNSSNNEVDEAQPSIEELVLKTSSGTNGIIDFAIAAVLLVLLASLSM